MFNSKKDYWIEFYNHTHDDFREGVTLSWEILKFYILLDSSLLSIVITLIGIFITSDNFATLSSIIKKGAFSLLLIFPLLILLITNVGKQNFTRECKRFYRYLSMIIKIEEGTGTRDEHRGKQVQLLKEDLFYVPSDFREIKDECGNIIGSGNDFVEFMVSGKADNFYKDSVKIFSLFEALSILLMVLVVFAIIIV